MDKSFKLNSSDSQEVLHKLTILRNEPDLLGGYGLTVAQIDELLASIPRKGGNWSVPAWAKNAVNGEMQDHTVVLYNMADDARNSNAVNESRRINRQAVKFEKLFGKFSRYE